MSEGRNDKGLLGACGLYCRACPRYRVTLEGGRYILDAHGADDYGDFHCLGCHSDKLSDFCRSCGIRLCAKGRGIHHCGLCPEFPCTDLEAFSEFGNTHDGARHRRDALNNLRRVNQEGAQAWLEGQNLRWRCSCGFIFSGYETVCHACGAKLDSWANSPSVEGNRP